MYEDEIPVGKAKDLRGQKFGKLTVLYRTKPPETKNKSAYWHCRCECGNELNIRADSLIKNTTTSCGCLKGHSSYKKIKIGDRFGKLEVIEITSKRGNGGNIIYRCKCDCGNYCETRGSRLHSKETTSCGCVNSKGEEEISKILQNNNIVFIKQKTFETCRFLETDKLAKFDFYINNSYLIEFDGI